MVEIYGEPYKVHARAELHFVSCQYFILFILRWDNQEHEKIRRGINWFCSRHIFVCIDLLSHDFARLADRSDVYKFDDEIQESGDNGQPVVHSEKQNNWRIKEADLPIQNDTLAIFHMSNCVNSIAFLSICSLCSWKTLCVLVGHLRLNLVSINYSRYLLNSVLL